MTEKFHPHLVEAPKEENGEQERVFDFVADEKTGELRVPNFGDINEPYNSDARDPDPETGLSKIERWLEVVPDPGKPGKYLKARFTDKAAFDHYCIEQLRRGRKIATEITKRSAEHMGKMLRQIKEQVSLHDFVTQLSEYIDSDPELRSQILGWDLKQLKNKPNEPSKFRLTIVFEYHLHKSGKKKKNFVGTYNEVIDGFENELDKINAPLRAVEA